MGKFKVGDRVYQEYTITSILDDSDYPLRCRNASGDLYTFTEDGRAALSSSLPSLKTADEMRKYLNIVESTKSNSELELENAYLKGQINILLKLIK